MKTTKDLNSNRKKIILIIIITLAVLIAGALIISNSMSSTKGQQFGQTPKATVSPEESSQPTEGEKEDGEGDSGFKTPSKEVTFNTETLSQSAKSVYYGVYYFKDDIYITSDNSERTPSASVIKVFIMQYVYDEIAAGKLTEDDVVSGSSIKNLVKTMIQNSDNNATNTLLDHFGMETINTYIKNCGYSDTEFQRKMLDFDAQKNGKENYTSLNDVMKFLEKLYNNKETFPYSTMLEIMKGQNIRTKLPQGIPQGTVIANKTGELSDVENDIGIVFTDKGDFAIAVLTDGVSSPQNARNAIADLANQAYDRINK